MYNADVVPANISVPRFTLFFDSRTEDEKRISILFLKLAGKTKCLFEEVDVASKQLNNEKTPYVSVVRYDQTTVLCTGLDPVNIRNKIEAVEERYVFLKALTEKKKLMVFIKGTPENPKCKFTRKLLEALSNLGVEYESFDILSDNSVREDLKEYSNWKTYPQIYIQGKLVGGLDVLMQLIEENKFLQLVKEEEK